MGVAMGLGGTEIARAAADLILLDDDVTTIVHAVADGRRIFGNLRHAFSYLIAFHAPLLLSAFLLPLLGAPILLLPIHLIWLELIVHPTSALVFESDPPPPNLMTQPPRKPHTELLRRDDWARAIVLGVALAVMVIATFSLSIRAGLGVEASRAAALITMFAGQISLVFVERAGRQPIWQVTLRDNRTIVPIATGTAASLALAILWTPMSMALHLATVSPLIATLSAVAGCLAVLWMQPLYALGRRSPGFKAVRSASR